MKGIKYQFKKFDNTKLDTGDGLLNERKEQVKNEYNEQELREERADLSRQYNRRNNYYNDAEISVKFGDVGMANRFSDYKNLEDLVVSTTSSSPNYDDNRDGRTKVELVMHYDSIIKRKDTLINELINNLRRANALFKKLHSLNKPTYSPSLSPTYSPSYSESPSWSPSPSPEPEY